MYSPERIDLKEDGLFYRSKKIENVDDLINDISVIKAKKDGLISVTRHYEDGWFLYIREGYTTKEYEKEVSCLTCNERVINFDGYGECRIYHTPLLTSIKCKHYSFGDKGVDPDWYQGKMYD